jgi:hypothetical protein
VRATEEEEAAADVCGGEEADPHVEAARNLWDLATDSDRSLFLHTNHVVDVIEMLLLAHDRQRPRLLELAVGCLANMAAVPEVAAALTAEEQLPTTLLRLWMTCPDALTVCLSTRVATLDTTRPCAPQF